MNQISGIDGKGFNNISLTIGQVYPENRPDDIDPAGGSEAILTYNSSRNSGEPRIAGVAYKGLFPRGVSEGGVIYLPFTFETAADLVQRKNFMSSVLEYFDLPAGIETTETLLPESFRVYQNYPNPFNPATTIKFEIPYRAKVGIDIYNSLGEKVGNIADTYFDEGTHQLTWNANSYASGVYFAKINIQTINGMYEPQPAINLKMILLK
jgi:hypothetical protein